MYKFILPAIAMLLPVNMYAQPAAKEKKVRCTVTDEMGRPVQGVFACPHGTEDTLVTNTNGVFVLLTAAPQQVGLYASGYEEKQILVSQEEKCIATLKREDYGDVDDTGSDE